MSKKIKNIIPKKEAPIKRDRDGVHPWVEEYMCIYGFNLKSINIGYIEKIADEYIQWILKNPKEIRISKFFINKGIPRQTFIDWTRRYEPLKLAHEFVHEVIADRRENMAVAWNPGLALKMLPFYDMNWRDIEEWRAQIKSDSGNDLSQKVVVLSELEYQKSTEDK